MHRSTHEDFKCQIRNESNNTKITKQPHLNAFDAGVGVLLGHCYYSRFACLFNSLLRNG